jgi:3-methylcrotonyl-CoA carboxylase alpha subunit
MIDSLLIANRGEIARRIIRTARKLGVRTIAVYSEADAGMPFVREADQAICIGPPPAAQSYLDQDRILAAAREAGASAIHPGYGFLSENAGFAEKVIAAGLIWVGAPPTAIRAMGLKDAAKKLMIAAGVPVTPGYLGDDQDSERLKLEAERIGYPVLIKAVAGGGGKGMRKVDASSDFEAALQSCRREATASFGDDKVLIEKWIESPRHIEVQVFGDTHGNVVHLFERDCSLQRRHQKVVEEAPAPGMDEQTRAAICEAAIKAAKAVDYVGAGTIEFIADASQGLRADRIWFMEMNTRLQVEHPVTEAITGQDLVEWQLRVACGEPLPKTQNGLAIDGWAIEARLYAENPANDFLPSPGTIESLVLPDGEVRVDAGVEQGDRVSPHYDPMIAKLIAHGSNRDAALDRLASALAGVVTWPVGNNAGFVAALLDHPVVRRGAMDTGFIAAELDGLLAGKEASDSSRTLAARALFGSTTGVSDDPWQTLAGFRLNAPASTLVRISDGRTTFDAPFPAHHAERKNPAVVRLDDSSVIVLQQGWPQFFEAPSSRHLAGSASRSDGLLTSPMPGMVIAVEVATGDRVSRGQRIAVIEAMKMETALTAPFDGMVTALNVAVGDHVVEGRELAEITPEVSAEA